MNKQKLKKVKRLSNELNSVIQDFEKKKGANEDELKNWIFDKYEEMGEALTNND